jgi:aromatic-L-amino-acid decarboxylase
MGESSMNEHEETLDPTDWEGMRSLGHRMVDDMIDYLKTVRERPVWKHQPDDVNTHFKQGLPFAPQDPAEVYEEFQCYVLPYPIGNIHPRFWGWLFGTGTIMGAYADFLAAVMNTNSGDLDHHSAIHLETQVINWCKEIMGFPHSASGFLTGGCSYANLIGLAVARYAKAGFDVRKKGLTNAPQNLVLYASKEVHSSIQKAVELMGLGSQSLRLVPVNEDYQIDIKALETAIALDRSAGYTPFCVVGAVGTVNTGAVDDLEALADLSEHEDLWLHVDGAFGAWAVLSETAGSLLKGMERADSLAFDLHKWMYLPYEIGCILVRDARLHHDAFALTPVYLEREKGGRGLTGGDLPWLTDYDFQLSRGFRALKAWMSFKEHGIEKLGRLVQQNIDQAHYLVELVEASPELELAAPVPLNVVCFRYVNPELDQVTLDALNQSIMVELQEAGIAVLSGTRITERFVLRVGHTNHRTQREDFDLLVHEVIRIGRELAKK